MVFNVITVEEKTRTSIIIMMFYDTFLNVKLFNIQMLYDNTFKIEII